MQEGEGSLTPGTTQELLSPYRVLVDELTQLALQAGYQMPADITQIGQDATSGIKGLGLRREGCWIGPRGSAYRRDLECILNPAYCELIDNY